jgi:hypothetical protein
MTLKIKESDWITVDFTKPETIPKVGNWYIVRCPGILFLGSPDVMLTIKTFKSDEVDLVWNNDTFVKNYDKCALIDLENIHWNVIDMDDLSTVPSDFEGHYLVKHVTNEIQDMTLYGSEEMRSEGDECAYCWEGRHIIIPIETGDKFVSLRLE